MLETAELGQSLSKEAFGKQSKALRVELLKVQRELLDADWPVIIVIGGVGAAGKGDVMNRLFDWMDAKGRGRRQALRTHQGAARSLQAHRREAVSSALTG